MVILTCPSCGIRNRVHPVASGTPRCAQCKAPPQSIPLLVVMRDGREIDRIVGALPRAALEQRLAPVLAP